MACTAPHSPNTPTLSSTSTAPTVPHHTTLLTGSPPLTEPTPAARDIEGAKSRVEKIVAGHAAVPIRDFTVEVIGSEIVVGGTVRSYYHKQAVTHLLLPEIGTLTLTNAIRVTQPH